MSGKRKKKMNISGFGLNQFNLIDKMAYNNFVIRLINDHDKRQIELQDEAGDNTYESVSFRMLKSLGERGLFNYFGWMPSLFVTIDTYSLKKEVIDALKAKYKNFPNLKV